MKTFFLKAFLFVLFFTNHYGVIAQQLIRGPYLQMGSPTAMTIRWKTDVPTPTKVTYGDTFLKTEIAESATLDTSHVVQLSGLQPFTKYFYSIGTDTQTFQADSSNYFYTSPLTGSTQRIRMVAFGDCGTGTLKQKTVVEKIESYFGNDPIDGWLLLGDNAYSYGYFGEYQSKFFGVYQNYNFMKHTVLWPTLGNHDYAGIRTWPSWLGTHPAYHELFTLPTNAECGGVASETESYYSYNYGNVHFVSLDSFAAEDGKLVSDTTSKQVRWLKQDLSANQLTWTVVYFHHPPYTKGSHNSDTETELVNLRQNLVKVLEDYKVDIVLNGHSHNYERSHFMKGHYDLEASFDTTLHAITTSSGRYDGSPNSCPYIKADSGIVFVVAGTAGWTGATSAGYPHNAMIYSNSSKTGALILDVLGNRFDVKYLSEDGEILDKFTLFKNVNQVVEKNINCGDTIDLSASWKDNFVWSNGIRNKLQITVDSLTSSSVFYVKDSFNCLQDEFRVHVNPYPTPSATSNSPVLQGNTLQLSGDFKGLGALLWTGPNGFQSAELNPSILHIPLAAAGDYQLRAIYKNCSSSIITNVEIIPLLATESQNNTSLTVFPNPTSDEIRVRFSSEKTGNYQLTIRDEIGRLLSSRSQFFTSNTMQEIAIPLQNLLPTSSTLFISIEGEGKKYSSKVVVK